MLLDGNSNSNVIFATDKFVQAFGDNYFTNTFNEKFINCLLEEQTSKVVDKIREYNRLVIESKTDYQYLINIKLPNGITSYRINIYPLFSGKGEVIGLEIRAKEFCLFPLNHIIKDEINTNIKLSSSKIKLTRRQKQIIFYLLLGYSQRMTAELLRISRGTVAKIIAEEICPKFNLPGTSSSMLVAEIVKYDFKYLIPSGILDTPTIIHIN